MFESKSDGLQYQNGQTLVPTAAELNAAAPMAAPAASPVSTNLPERERIQRTIIEYFIAKLTSDFPTTLRPQDNSAKRRYLLQALRENKISSADEDAYLKTLPMPISLVGSRHIFEQISIDLRQKQILAIVTGHNISNWQDVLAKDIDDFLAAPRRNQPDYRTPVGFADLRRRFLHEIQQQATPTQLDDYIKSMDDFEQNLYGERFIYYLQIEALRKEAVAQGQSIDTITAVAPDSTTPVVAKPQDSLAASNAISTSPVSEAPAVPLSPVSDERRDQLLSHATIDGDYWHQGGQDYRLGIPSLVNAGLEPFFEVSVDNQPVYLSNLFQLTSEQMAAIAYIPSPTGVKVRSFYRNKNRAIWHYFPDYIRDISGEGIDVFGAGFHEKSTTLPIILQAALNQIERNRDIIDLSTTNPDFLFAGTAYAYNTRQEYRDAYNRGILRGDFYREVSSTAYNADSGAVITQGRRKIAPQLLSVNAETAPNFETLITRYSAYSGFAGQIMGEGFPANDKQTNWLFYSDYRGRCWVANIETISPVTSTGCRREWLLPTDISTPLYESTHLADGYGDPSDTRNGSYISMWNNYLSKIPLLQQYLSIITRTRNPRE